VLPQISDEDGESKISDEVDEDKISDEDLLATSYCQGDLPEASQPHAIKTALQK